MLIKINPHNPQQRLITRVVDVLKRGGVVVYPTDTNYGIGCDIMNKKAIQKIYGLKQRSKNQPFSFICSNLKNISQYAKVTNYAYKTMRRLLPGPYTFIVPATPLVPKIMLRPQKMVGVRIPNSRIVRDVVEELGRPLISTSATLEDGTILNDPEEIERRFRSTLDIVIAENCPGEPSSIIDLTQGEPIVIRKGRGDLSWLS